MYRPVPATGQVFACFYRTGLRMPWFASFFFLLSGRYVEPQIPRAKSPNVVLIDQLAC